MIFKLVSQFHLTLKIIQLIKSLKYNLKML